MLLSSGLLRLVQRMVRVPVVALARGSVQVLLLGHVVVAQVTRWLGRCEGAPVGNVGRVLLGLLLLLLELGLQLSGVHLTG